MLSAFVRACVAVHLARDPSMACTRWRQDGPGGQRRFLVMRRVLPVQRSSNCQSIKAATTLNMLLRSPVSLLACHSDFFVQSIPGEPADDIVFVLLNFQCPSSRSLPFLDQ